MSSHITRARKAVSNRVLVCFDLKGNRFAATFGIQPSQDWETVCFDFAAQFECAPEDIIEDDSTDTVGTIDGKALGYYKIR